MRIELIRDSRRLEGLREQWNCLLAHSQSHNLFLTWEWLFTWWKFLGGSRRLNIVCVYSGSTLVGLLPLVRSAPKLLRCRPSSLEFLGTGVVGSDYLDFIVRKGHEREVLEAVTGHLLEEGTTLSLSHYLQGSANISEVIRAWRDAQAEYREGTVNSCPFIDCSNLTWDAYLTSLGSEHRYNFRRRLRQIEAKFQMRLEIAQSETERQAGMATLIDLHGRRRKVLGGTEAFSSPALCAFHDEVSRIGLQRGWLRLYTLWLDDTPAASLYGFLYDRIFYFYQSGFDPSFKVHSVGLVLMGLVIREAIEEDAVEYDFLHGAEQYKFLWTNRIRQLGCAELYPPGFRGRVWKAARGANQDARAVVRKMLSFFGAGRGIPTTVKSGGTVYVAGRS